MGKPGTVRLQRKRAANLESDPGFQSAGLKWQAFKN